NRLKQLALEGFVVKRQGRLERAYQIADHVFRRIVDESRKPVASIELGGERARNGFDQEGMLRDRKSMIADCLAVPTRDPRETVRDILDLDVERRRVQQVQPASAQHTLPGPRGWRGKPRHGLAYLRAAEAKRSATERQWIGPL